jgi:hypothetical protein
MARIHRCLATCVLVMAAPVASAQDSPRADSRKEAVAIPVATGIIRLDGRLEEEVWLKATPITDFVQKEPTEGAEPTDRMEVRFMYDGGALFVGARMFTTNAPAIQAPLGLRDSSDQTEHIQIWLDTFLDRRSAAMFGITAAGVRLDRLHSTDNEDGADSGFNPVWEAAASMTADGWTAELWIPFSQLRFNRHEEHTWGLNIRRFRPTLDEEDYWVMVPRTERVFISRFGDLRGISGIHATRRVELLPYVAGASTMTGERDLNNPFDDGKNLKSRVGADMKIGMGPSLTLEATINPDFGQVEADAAEVNLTAFETRFPERRPFFLEGSSLFANGNNSYYYSRRMGARPRGPANDEFVDYPTENTILVAAKLTGRLPSRTSIGFLSAITDEESARLANVETPGIRSIRVAPRAYHGIARVRQEFGTLGSNVGFLVNGLHRDLSDTDPLADLLAQNALAVAGDTLLRFKGGEYEYRLNGGGSFVGGTEDAIERIQRSSSHYLQRPDHTSPIDPTRTSLAGWSFLTNFDRVSGRHWLWGGSLRMESLTFETNDVASLTAADGMLINTNIRYRETQPGRVFRSYSIQLNQSSDSTRGLLLQRASLRPNVSVTWANFWTSSASLTRDFSTQSVSLTRGGPVMAGPGGWTTSFDVGNRTTSYTRWSASVTLATTDVGGSRERVSGSLSIRPGPRWRLSANPYYERETETQQYVTTITGGGRVETYDNRYIFAYIDRSTAATEFRMGYTFRPDLNLDVYAEPFAASGRYYNFGELARPRTMERITYGVAEDTTITTNDNGTRAVTVGDQSFTLRTTDFKNLSFRSNVVLRWEWRPGSTLYFVWQQDRSNTEVVGTRVNVGDVFRSLSAPGQNFFVIKTSFWLPVG